MKVIIQHKAAIKLKYFIDLTDDEISGMGKSFIKDNNIIIQDFIIFNQTCSSVNTDIDSQGIAKFLYELQKKGERTEDWGLWWHSHADMGVFWSEQDDKTIREHSGGGSHLISLVSNKKGEFKSRLDIFPTDKSPFGKTSLSKTYDLKTIIELKPSFTKQMDKIESIIQKAQVSLDKLVERNSTDVAIKKLCQKEIDKKIKKPAEIVSQSYSFDYNKNGMIPKKKWVWWNEWDENDFMQGGLNSIDNFY